MITVDYPPGGAVPVHRHSQRLYICLKGINRDADEGWRKSNTSSGDTFYEDPEGIHLIGRNASDTKPAQFLVLLIKEKGAPILTPVNE